MKGSLRIISAAAAAVMGISVCCTAVGAVADDTLYTAAGYTSEGKGLAERIKRQLKAHSSKTLDISAYGLTMEEFEELYVTMLFNEPSLFYVSPISAYIGYADDNVHVRYFTPVYNYSTAETKELDERLDEYTRTLLSGVHDEWSDTEKVLYVHDYIASHAVYYEGSSISAGRNIVDLFMNESSVCVGYAMGFQYIMDIMGIPCISITNEDHIWNMVSIDDCWYYVDVTWDDSLTNAPNFTLHNMLLLSEYGLDNATPVHKPWDYSMTADSNKYDKFFWQNSCSAMVYLDGYWYYTTSEGLCRYSFKTKKEQLIYKINSSWKAPLGGEWIISFSQLQLKDGQIYFNTPDRILKYSPSENAVYSVCKPDIPAGYDIYDLKIEGNNLKVYSGQDVDSMTARENNYILKGDTAVSNGSKQTADDNVPFEESVSVTDNGDTITVSWAEVQDAEQYVVYRRREENGSIITARIASVADNSVTFKKSGRDEGSSYSVRVRRADGLGDYAEWTVV